MSHAVATTRTYLYRLSSAYASALLSRPWSIYVLEPVLRQLGEHRGLSCLKLTHYVPLLGQPQLVPIRACLSTCQLVLTLLDVLICIRCEPPS